MRETVGETETTEADAPVAGIPGIIIHRGRRNGVGARHPRIQAFVWGGKVRQAPILPYGRWKGAA